MKTLTAGALSAALGLCLSAGPALADTVDDSFYPYRDSVPTHPFVKPGVVLTADNVDQAKDALDEAMYRFIKEGSVTVTVGETMTLDLHPAYVEATRKYHEGVSLGDGPGILLNHIAGRPFPKAPDLNDPRAGEKQMWNFKYSYNQGDGSSIVPFWWKFKNMRTGKVERTIKFSFHFMNFMHRVVESPLPEYADNPSQIYRATYMKVLEPFDVKNTQLLILRYEDDLKRDDAWLYLGFQRRVRRLATGQVTDSFLGTDLMIEDFEGFNGRNSDYDWTYVETRNILLSFYRHNEMPQTNELDEPDGFQFLQFHGKGNCFPKTTWQLRRVYIVVGVPKESGHPIGKRVTYLDAQTYAMGSEVIYDRKGEIWKNLVIGKSDSDYHAPINKGAGVAIDDSVGMIDLQTGHCTTLQFKVNVDPSGYQRSMFTVQNLRATGR